MSERNWGERIAYFLRGYWSSRPLSWWDINRVILSVTVQIIAIYLLAGLGLSIWSGYNAKLETYHQEKQRAQAEHHQASRNISSECAVSNAPPGFVAECLAAHVEAYERRRNTNQDLQAQQDMAYWALLMFGASAAGLLVSVGGLILLLRSLRQTETAISTDREVGHAQVRAYLTIDPGMPDAIKPGHMPVVEIKIKNTGQSPAYFVKYIATIRVETHPLSPGNEWYIFPASEQTETVGMTLPSQGDFAARAEGAEALTAEDIQSAMNGADKRIYLACIVYYKDVFREQRITRFCAYLDDSGKTLPGPDGRMLKAYSWVVAPINNEAT